MVEKRVFGQALHQKSPNFPISLVPFSAKKVAVKLDNSLEFQYNLHHLG
jgi:hypothetical protein